jgi:hypothetical protein|nr:MAG TPA: hypothetical protein [Caudoviricetes sp.]DAX05297.1 MAG TPA: hypothetical protein [Caudoviricetes sp.]
MDLLLIIIVILFVVYAIGMLIFFIEMVRSEKK